jgi:hypothetical protein
MVARRKVRCAGRLAFSPVAKRDRHSRDRISHFPGGTPPLGVFVCKVFMADDLWVDLVSTLRVKVSRFKDLADFWFAKY